MASPPYYNLRDYGADGQIGLEATPDEYVSRLVDVFREVRRVLRDDGTLWLNLGDSYAGSRKGGASHPENAGNYKQGTNRGMIGQRAVTKGGFEGYKPKDLMGIPWRVAFALQADGWYLRQDIIWHKPNPMPESVTDRCTSSHEYMFLLSKSQYYYFDYEAIKEPAVGFDNSIPAGSVGAFGPLQSRRRKGNAKSFRGGGAYTNGKSFDNSGTFDRETHGNRENESGTRNKRSVWTVSIQPFKDAHFATFPPKLIEPCILAGAPPGGTVLDPFAGSGTVGAVATEFGRKYVLVDLNPQYCEMAFRRTAQQSLFI